MNKTEKRYKDFFDNLENVIIIHDSDGKMIEFNRAAYDKLGYSQERLKKINLFDIIPPENRSIMLKALHDARKRGASTVETTLLNKKLHQIPVEANVRTINPGGQDVMMSIFTDITDIRKARDEKEDLESQLQQSQKMEALGRLAGGIAHDFNNILTVVTANALLAMMDMDEYEKHYKQLQEVLRASGSATDLIRQLLAFSRNQIIEPKVLDLNEIMEKFQKMLKRIIGEDIHFEFIPQHGIWFVKADPGQIEQIIANLCVNARDAMPAGGNLTIKTENITIAKSARNHPVNLKSGDYLIISVKDTGSGIDPKHLNRIFEPFFSTKPQEQGTGLGLATVYGIIQQHNGDIEVVSEVEKGTEFKVYFPRVQEPKDKLSDRVSLGNWPKGTETILFAEDDESLRKIMEKTLKRLGYNVLVAENGEVAINISNEHKDTIHLIITDVVMPVVNGKLLVDRLIQDRPDIKVLFTSGYTNNIAFNDILEKGYKFISKPYRPQVIAEKIRELLDGKNKQD